MSVSVLNAMKKRTRCASAMIRNMIELGGVQSPLGTLEESAGPEDQVSMLVEAMKSESLIGAPGLEISFTSLSVTPVVSPSPLVEAMTPS